MTAANRLSARTVKGMRGERSTPPDNSARRRSQPPAGSSHAPAKPAGVEQTTTRLRPGLARLLLLMALTRLTAGPSCCWRARDRCRRRSRGSFSRTRARASYRDWFFGMTAAPSVGAAIGRVFLAKRATDLGCRIARLAPDQQRAVLSALNERRSDAQAFVMALRRALGLTTEVVPATAPDARGSEASPAENVR